VNGAEGLLRHDPEVAVLDPDLAAIVVKTVEALTHNSVVHGDHDAYVEEIVRLVASYLTAGKSC